MLIQFSINRIVVSGQISHWRENETSNNEAISLVMFIISWAGNHSMLSWIQIGVDDFLDKKKTFQAWNETTRKGNWIDPIVLICACQCFFEPYLIKKRAMQMKTQKQQAEANSLLGLRKEKMKSFVKAPSLPKSTTTLCLEVRVWHQCGILCGFHL